MRQKERSDQMALVQYARFKYPGIAIIMSPIQKMAGTPRQQMIQAVNRKRMGYEKGTLDLFFAKARGGYHGLFIEMKKQNGVPSDISPEQNKMAIKLADEGYSVSICFGYENAVRMLDKYMLINRNEK
jgi:hypothetical protein